MIAISDALTASLEADRVALPITYSTVKRLNAEEPYRLKQLCPRAAAAHPRPVGQRHRARAGP